MINANKQATGKITASLSTAARVMPSKSAPEVIREIVEAFNPVIADGFALYEKTKNFYLNAAESPDRDHQLLFDEQAREIFASIDELAERMRQMGAVTVRSISHTGELQGVENYNGNILAPGKMIEELIADNQRIAASLRAAGKLCEKMLDSPTGIILQDILNKTESRIRFLGEAKMKIRSRPIAV